MSRLSQLMRRVPGVRRVPGIRKRRRPEWQMEPRDVGKSYALNDLDRKLVKFLGTEPGFFIEAGANDGISQSNSLYFEKNYQWTGLLIEPIPELAKRCRKNRPNCSVINSALVPIGYPESTIEMEYCNLMSLVRGAMKSEEADEEHLSRGREVQNIDSYSVPVNAQALSDILDRQQIQQIDLLSLDVEGFELNALKGIDFARHRPKWMLIEARFRDEIDDFLSPWYEPVAELSHHDVLYRAVFEPIVGD